MEITTENVEFKEVSKVKAKSREAIKSDRNSNRIVPSPMIDSIETLHPGERQTFNASNTSSLMFPAINE